MTKKNNLLLIGAGIIVIILVNLLIFGFFSTGKTSTGDTKLKDTTVLFVQGSYEEYLANIDKSGKKNDGDELYRQAIAHVKIGEFSLAEDKLYKAYALVQNPITEKLLRSITLYNKGDIVGGLKMITNLKSKNPQEQSTIDLLQGVYLVDQKGFKKATPLLIKTVDADPASSAAAYYLGLSQMGEKKWNVALESLQRADSLNYKGSDLYARLGSVSGILKDRAGAITYYEKALLTDAKNKDIVSSLADAYNKNKQYDLAIKTYDTLIQLDPDNIGPYRMKATLLVGQDRLEEAINAYDELEKRVDQTKTVEIWIEKMTLYHTVGNIAKRDEMMQRINVNISDDIGLASLFANKLMSMGYYDEAGQYVTFLLGKQPKDKNARELYGKWLIGNLLSSFSSSEKNSNEILSELQERYTKFAHTKYFSMVTYGLENDFEAALRAGQEIDNSIGDSEIRLSIMFYYLFEENYSRAGEIMAVLKPADLGTTDYLWLQWYLQSKLGNTERLVELQSVLKEQTVGLTDDIFPQSFEKAFDRHIKYYQPYYPNNLFGSIVGL